MMPIPVPVTKTKIATVPWGIPLTNEVNRLTTVTTPTAWTNVTYQNGWSNYGGTLAPVQYRKIGDIVYIRGAMKGGGLGTVAAFTLPSGFRPPANCGLYIGVLCGGGAYGYGTIDAATGNVAIASVGTGNNGQVQMETLFSITS